MKSSSKMMFAVAVVALFAVAAIGVGYAYTSLTHDANNNVGQTFLTLNDDYSTVDINSDVVWNTENTADNTYTAWMDGIVSGAVGSRTEDTTLITNVVDNTNLRLLGSVTLTLTGTVDDSGKIPSSVSIKADTEGLLEKTYDTDKKFTYYITVDSASDSTNIANNNTAFYADSDTLMDIATITYTKNAVTSSTIVLKLYIKDVAVDQVDHSSESGPNNTHSLPPITGVTDMTSLDIVSGTLTFNVQASSTVYAEAA